MFSLDPHCQYFINTMDFLLKLIGGAGGLYLFFIGLKRYFKDQIWRRNEFVANEMKEFNAEPMVKNVMYILDWGARYIELFPNKPDYEDRYAKVDRKILKSALQYHKYKINDPLKDRFTSVEVAIRDNFDCFLSYLERFEHYMEAKLITPEELEPYLRYWVKTIAKDIEPDVRNFIYHFINIYEYKGTQNLFKRFGMDITPQTDIETTKVIEEEKEV